MFPNHCGHNDKAECRQHSERVAAMASCAASALGFSPVLRNATEIAALSHSDWTAFSNQREGTASGKTEFALAKLILSARRGNPTARTEPELAGDLVAACHELDGAAERAVLDRVPLREAIAKYLSSASELHHPAILTKLREVTKGTCRPLGRLPVFPVALNEVLQTREETTDAATLSTIASSDQGLAVWLLSAANSAVHAPPCDITGLREAALWLGVPMTRKVLIQACVGPLFASAPLSHLWRHSRLVAAAAAQLAVQINIHSDLAYTAGLLHDIGRLGYETAAGGIKDRVRLLNWLSRGFPLTYAETITYGPDHAQAGARLLWDVALPEEIVEAVAMHHTPEFSGARPLSALLFIAELWYERRYKTSPESLSADARLQMACNRLNLPTASIDELDSQTPLLVQAEVSEDCVSEDFITQNEQAGNVFPH